MTTIKTPTHLDKMNNTNTSLLQNIKINTKQQAREYIEQTNITHLKVGVFDINGILRGKYLSKQKFFSALESGCGFCDVVLGSDIDDQLCNNMTYTGWHTGYPDATIQIVAESCRQIPFEPDTLLFLAEFSGASEQLCPRSILKNVTRKAHDMGFDAFAAGEYEFAVFNEDIQSVRDKHFRNLTPITPGNFGYSMLRNTVFAEFYQQLLACGEQMNFPIEGLHTEIGPGVLEAAVTYDQALPAADKAAIFKTMTKVIAQRYGWIATFMAKINTQQQGHSGHIHLSLRDLANESVFYDEKAPYHMSDTMRHFVAGQLHYMPELLAMVAPTINSFSRLVPGHWAPTQANWGYDNRTTALRVIGGKASSQRVEYRVPGADSNPYLAIAAALASGLWGIEQQLELPDPISGNAYQQPINQQLQLPRNLWDAAQRLKQCQPARQWFGDLFVDDYAAKCEWEVQENQRQITDWQLERYFELA